MNERLIKTCKQSPKQEEYSSNSEKEGWIAFTRTRFLSLIKRISGFSLPIQTGG